MFVVDWFSIMRFRYYFSFETPPVPPHACFPFFAIAENLSNSNFGVVVSRELSDCVESTAGRISGPV